MSKKTKTQIKRTVQECALALVLGTSVFGSMLWFGLR